jgi:hypothetical protein
LRKCRLKKCWWETALTHFSSLLNFWWAGFLALVLQVGVESRQSTCEMKLNVQLQAKKKPPAQNRPQIENLIAFLSPQKSFHDRIDAKNCKHDSRERPCAFYNIAPNVFVYKSKSPTFVCLTIFYSWTCCLFLVLFLANVDFPVILRITLSPMQNKTIDSLNLYLSALW